MKTCGQCSQSEDISDVAVRCWGGPPTVTQVFSTADGQTTIVSQRPLLGKADRGCGLLQAGLFKARKLEKTAPK
jgi:hypothetical protein